MSISGVFSLFADHNRIWITSDHGHIPADSRLVMDHRDANIHVKLTIGGLWIADSPCGFCSITGFLWNTLRMKLHKRNANPTNRAALYSRAANTPDGVSRKNFWRRHMRVKSSVSLLDRFTEEAFKTMPTWMNSIQFRQRLKRAHFGIIRIANDIPHCIYQLLTKRGSKLPSALSDLKLLETLYKKYKTNNKDRYPSDRCRQDKKTLRHPPPPPPNVGIGPHTMINKILGWSNPIF